MFRDVPFRFKLVECFGVGRIFVHVDHSWLAAMGSGKRFQQELFRCFCISCWAEEEIERVPLRIKGSIEVHPLLFHLDVRLVHKPRVVRGFEVGPTALLQFWCIALDPAIDRRMINVQAPFEQHLFQIAVAQSISEVPADAQQNDVGLEMTPFERMLVKTYPYPGNLGQLMGHKHIGELYFTDRFEL